MFAKSQYTVIYLPGLGDGYDSLRRFLLRTWSVRRVKVIFIPMRWRNRETYSEKRDRVAAEIKKYGAKNIIVVGESAGGSMALNLYAEYPRLAGVVTLCGVTTIETPIGEGVKKRHPAFWESVEKLEKSREVYTKAMPSRILQVTSSHDPSVPRAVNLIVGTMQKRLVLPGHLVPIMYFLAIAGPRIIKAYSRKL